VEIAPVDHYVIARLRKGILAYVAHSEREVGLLEFNVLLLGVYTSAGADTENKSHLSVALGSDLIRNVAYGTRKDIESVKEKGSGKGKLKSYRFVIKVVYSACGGDLYASLIDAALNKLSVGGEACYGVKVVVDINACHDGAGLSRPMLCGRRVKRIVT
jgi:hypothetical protein